MAKQETSAGSYPGAKMMGLSLKRAGDTNIDTLGCPAPAGKSPVNPRKPGGFNSPGTRRAGKPDVIATGRMGVAGESPTKCC